jgi:flavorubredoxin
MHNEKILYDDGVHKCIMFSIDEQHDNEKYLSVNQYLIIQKEDAFLIDPGSANSFFELSEAISKYVSLQQVKYVFFSHQDPDVAGSIAQWNIQTSAKIIVSKIWVRFMSHYGLMDMSKVLILEDIGAKLKFGNDFLQFIPAHFLHSPGNFSLYDSRSKILFSGDIGALIMPLEKQVKEVKSFEEIKKYVTAFHTRYMAGNIFCRAWVKKVQNYDIEMMAPQHGALYHKEEINYFFEWFKELQCGGDLLKDLYG